MITHYMTFSNFPAPNYFQRVLCRYFINYKACLRYVGAISVPSLPETWETLVKGLPEDMTQGLQELPNLMDDKLGSLSVFQQTTEHMSAGAPGSYVDQALNYELPPSTHYDVVAVLNAVFGENFRDLSRLCDYFNTQLTTFTSSTYTSSVSSEVIFETFRAYYEYTLYLGDKEASARGILVLFMELVRDALQKRHPNKKFYIDYVFRFSSDAALIVASTGQNRMDVVFSLEYKPKVASQLKDQRPFHISELFLQAFF